MINAELKNRYAIPVDDGNMNNPFNRNRKPKPHLGIDVSWYKLPVPKGLIYACQEGKVVDIFNNTNSLGYGIILQHDYSDKTYSFSGYIHLHQKPTLKIGDYVKLGDVIGIKGNTGDSNGAHLHFYLTGYTTKPYDRSDAFWNNVFKPLCIDPMPYLYKTKAINYIYLGDKFSSKAYLEDFIQNYYQNLSLLRYILRFFHFLAYVVFQ